MAFTNVLYRDFRGAANSASPGTGLVDRAGGKASISAGNLVIAQEPTGYGYLLHDTYATGTDAQIDSEVEFLIPANYGPGNGTFALLRGQQFMVGGVNPWGTEHGCYGLELFNALDRGGNLTYFFDGYTTDNRAGSGAPGNNGTVPGFTTAKSYWVRFRVVGASPTTVSLSIWEDTGAATAGGDTSVAHGTQVLNASIVHDNTPTNLQYLQNPGVAGFWGDSYYGANGGTWNDSKIPVARFAVQPSTPALTAPLPTTTSRTTTVNTLLAAPTGGVSPYTVAWYTKLNDPTLPAISGNLLSDTTATVPHTHGDAAGTLRFYRYKVTDSASTAVLSGVRMVEALRPTPGALPPLRADLIGGRKLIYATWGDSISADGQIQTQVFADLAAQGITNVTLVNGAQQGSALTGADGWGPNATLSYNNGVNNWNTTSTLFVNFMSLITTAMAANPGALLVVSGMILTNDAQYYSTLASSNATVQQTFQDFFAAVQTQFPNALQIINCQPYGTSGNISASAHIAELGWRTATASAVTAAIAAGQKVVLGDSSAYYAFYVNPSLLSDGIHPNGAGSVALGHLHADPLMRYSLLAPPTVVTPTFSPVAGAVTSGTVVTFSSATAGVTFYRTTDGTTPTTASTAGSTVTITGAVSVKVLAVKAGMTDSAVATAAYTITVVSDTTPPTLTARTIPAAGNSLTATLSEAGCLPSSGTGGFTLTGTAGSRTVTAWAVSGTTLTLTLSGLVYSTDAPLLTYDRAATVNDITDAAGNFLASFTAQSVTNSSTQTAPVIPGTTSPTLEALLNRLVTVLAPDGGTQVLDNAGNLIQTSTFAGNTYVLTAAANGTVFSSVYTPAGG